MEVVIKEEGEGYVLEFKDIDKAYVHALKDILKNSKKVEEVAILKTHPYLENIKMWIKISGKNLKEILKEAIDELDETLEINGKI